MIASLLFGLLMNADVIIIRLFCWLCDGGGVWFARKEKPVLAI